jgi:capsular polysaccharide biosynthesis protein
MDVLSRLRAAFGRHKSALVSHSPVETHGDVSKLPSSEYRTRPIAPFLERTWTVGNAREVTCSFPHASPLPRLLTYPELNTYLLRDVRVLSDSSIAMDRRGAFLLETTLSPGRLHKAVQSYLKKPFSEVQVTGLCTVLDVGSPWRNYYHFMVEVLNRTHGLWHPEIQKLGPIQVYLTTPNVSDDQLKLLRSLLPENATLTQSKSRVLRADRFLALPYITRSASGYVLPQAIQRLQEAARQTFGILPVDRPRQLILISRRKAALRRVLNEDELLEALKPRGFRRLDLEDLPLKEQVALFQDARAVVAPHGAGLTNLLFSQPACKVVELFAGDATPHYRHLCQAADLSYADVVGSHGRDKNADFLVDVAAVVAKLNALDARR